jgi:hypothetical protein
MTGTLLPSAEAASCPQLAEGDIRALGQRTGFDPQRTNAAAMQQFFGISAALSGSVLCAGVSVARATESADRSASRNYGMPSGASL